MSTVAKYYFEDYDSYTAAVKRMCSEVGDNGSWDCERPYIWTRRSDRHQNSPVYSYT